MDIKKFCSQISYQFKDENLLIESITHPSLSSKKNQLKNYERLEFLGDKVLSLVIAEHLIQKYKNEKEGDLSKRQAFLISGETISKVALDVGLNSVIKISKGEANLGGNTNKKNLENALEALIGAIYLDSDFLGAKKFIMKFWEVFFNEECEPPKDPISKLQEIVQVKLKRLPEYEVVKTSGLEHKPIFTANLAISHLNIAVSGSGKSKKEAQKQAAIFALQIISNNSKI
jgi:ribonuclease-3